jgi:hypothetical protein
MTHPAWFALQPGITPDHLGFIPSFLDEDDPDDAATQLDKHYAHGGGFRQTVVQFEVPPDYSELRYPEDPPRLALAATKLRDETIILYESAWVLVRKADGTHVIARMD